MTRYTSIGYKRKYIEAGFNHDTNGKAIVSANNEQTHVSPLADSDHDRVDNVTDNDHPASSLKKRRRTAKVSQNIPGNESKIEFIAKKENGQANTDAVGEEELDNRDSAVLTEKKDKLKKGKTRKNLLKKVNDAAMKQAISERRRLMRINERHASTVCFACREMGHAAKDCPAADTALEGEEGNPNNTGNALGKNAVGMCYRCGSKTHSLSRCKRRENPDNPLPFAACFICSARGHLASSCPKNGGRGVYPKGGACKICGETSHLARNCKLRSQDISAGNAIFGIGMDANVGADEDDFHIFNRRKTDVEKEERIENRARRNVKVGALTGVVKAFPVAIGRAGDASIDNSAPRVAKNVVYF